MKTLILLDGSAYLFRAFHALPPLSNALGQPTGAVYGITTMLQKILQDYQPDYAAVVFDAKGKNFRHDLYPDYKANRPATPEELVEQVVPAHDVVQALGFPLLMEAGVEADDVIATLTRQALAAEMQVLIFSGDKDLAQLVNEQVQLVNPQNEQRLDAAAVKEKYGVSPDNIVAYLSLMGDSSDNVPGVAKVGAKTAVKWLDTYGSLDGVIANVDKIKGKVGDNLRAGLEQLALSKQLVTLKDDVTLERAVDSLHLGKQDTARLRALFEELGFKRLLKQLEASKNDEDEDEVVAESEPTVTTQYDTVLTQADFDAWLAKLRQADLFAFDTETTSLDYLQAEIVGVSFAVEPYTAAYVPLAHDYLDAPQQLDRDTVLNTLKPLLENPDKAKVGQNLKYDAHVLANAGIQLRGIAYDTMLESYVLNSTHKHDMDSLAERLLSVSTIHYEDVAGKGAKQIPFSQVALEQATPYAAEDADITLQLHHTQWSLLQANEILLKVFNEIEMRLLPVLLRMERNGVCIDTDKLAVQSMELASRMQAVETQVHDAAGATFNLNSPKQLQAILFEQAGLPVLAKTPKGQPSTAESVLQELAADYPLPALILEYRSLSKLKSTYTDALPQQIQPHTGRVHTSYQQAVTVTGRLSSTEPNLQNIPVRTPEGRRVRQAFVAPKGYKLLAADYSQIELRIMAHLSGDTGLLNAFQNEQDIHRATAAEVFEVPLADVSKDQRRSAKAINFGLIYGMSAFGLAKQLHVERSEAQRYIDAYFDRYPGVKTYMDTTQAFAREHGYVETVFGRRLYLPEIKSRNAQRRQYAERSAINAPMQGTAADIIKKAMIAIDDWLQTSAVDAQMTMQVHDELVFEVVEGDLETVQEEIVKLMSAAVTLRVPLVVDVGVGENWDEAH